MRSKKTQKDWVVEQLRIDGFISRNWCLKNYISRLSAIIYNLKQEGMTFEEKWVEGDFRYYLTKDNKRREVLLVRDADGKVTKEITRFV